MAFSEKLLARPEAASPEALKRIDVAKGRIQSILDRERVSHQKTLEQKISDQGPNPMRVDPHLVGLAILDLLELNRVKAVTHPASGKQPWYANLLTSAEEITSRLDTLAPLHQSTMGGFSNLIGDALEIVIEKCLAEAEASAPKFAYQGHFLLNEPSDKHGRYKKLQPPKSVGANSTAKEADFLQFGHDEGVICIECKNYREWIYPHSSLITELIVKASELNCIPMLIARRIHYTARENFLKPAGILFHETLYQYYPLGHDELVAQVRDKTLLGFSDVRATMEPDKRTQAFFLGYLPTLVGQAANLWNKNRGALVGYAAGQMNLGELYKAIESPGAAKQPDDIPF